MISLLHYLSGEVINVFGSFQQDRESVMTVEDGPVGPSLKRTWLSRPQRELQLFRRKSPELRKLNRIQQIIGVEEPELRLHFAA
jgi:hypothetical protein